MTDRAVAEWQNRVAAEYRSAALAADVLHHGILVGWPEALLHTVLRIVRDELDHARLSHDCVEALGGGDAPIVLHAAHLCSGTPMGSPFEHLLDGVVRDFCLGETFAVPLFAAMRKDAALPIVRDTLTRILADEAIHRQFGWDALDQLLTIEGARERVQLTLPGHLAAFQDAYAPPGEAPPLTLEERAAGLLSLPDYRHIFEHTMAADVLPRFAARGVVLG